MLLGSGHRVGEQKKFKVKFKGKAIKERGEKYEGEVSSGPRAKDSDLKIMALGPQGSAFEIAPLPGCPARPMPVPAHTIHTPVCSRPRS